MALRYVTRELLVEVLGEEVPNEAEVVSEVIVDTQAIHAKIAEDPWLTESALRTWGEGEGIDPDRMNRALKVLEATGQVASVSLTAAQIPETEEGEGG